MHFCDVRDASKAKKDIDVIIRRRDINQNSRFYVFDICLEEPPPQASPK